MPDGDGNGLAKCRHGIALNEVCTICNDIIDKITNDSDDDDE